MRRASRGMLITLEGNEGSGKSTQIRLLYNFLKKKGYRVFLTREPGGTKISDGIRKILLDNRHKKMTAVTETLLYMASRTQLVEEVIKPRLKKGELVLCDRWLDATLAYQGYGGGVDKKWIEVLGKGVTQGIRPSVSLFLELPLACGLRRARQHKKADRMERKERAFHRRVRQGYLRIAKADPRRFKRIKIKEGDRVSFVHEKIVKAVLNVL